MSDPYCLQFNQNMTTDCLLLSSLSYPFLPDFTCCKPEILLKVKTNLVSQQAEIGKNT